jgi:sec-independent protein translocase protein TatC
MAVDQSQTTHTSDSVKPSAMPFLHHIEELRKRLLKCALAVILCSSVAFAYAEQIVSYFVAPLHGIELHVTEVTGSFMAYFKISLVGGLLAAMPVVLYQLWSFVSPGLYPSEKKKVLPVVFASTLLFLGGAAFCYFLILPMALEFLISFSDDLFTPIITVTSYISFTGMMLLGFGLSFQLPVIAYFLGRVGVVNSGMLSRGRRYAVIVILIVAGFLTPTPDIFTQLMMAVPLYLLYELSILLVRFTGKERQSV